LCGVFYFISHTSLTLVCWSLRIETAAGNASMWFYKFEQYDPIWSYSDAGKGSLSMMAQDCAIIQLSVQFW